MEENTYFRKRIRDMKFLTGLIIFCLTIFIGQNVYAQEPCEIEIELIFPEYGDITEWELIDGAGDVVLQGGYYDYLNYEDFTITEVYMADNPPYQLRIVIDDAEFWGCDNFVYYTVSVGGVLDVEGEAFACFDRFEETIPLTADFTACIPDCSRPRSLGMNASNPTSGTLEWSGTGVSYDIEWGLQGFVQGSADGTLISNVGVTNYAFSNLAIGEVYQFYVRQNCGDEDGVSDWAGPFNYAVPVVMPSPWHEEFEEMEVAPLGWSIDENSWYIDELYPEEEISLITNLYSFLGWGGLTTANFKTVAVGPIFNGDTFSFNYIYEDSYMGGGVENGLGNMVVEFSTDFGATYTVIDTIETNGVEGWQTYSQDMTAYAGQYVKIRITANLLDIFGIPDYFLSFDQFDISGGVNLCFEVEEVTISDITNQSAVLTMVSEGTSFDIEYGETGFTPGEGTVILGVDSSYELTGLLDGMEYEVYVRSNICAPVFGPVSFTTVDLGEPQNITVIDVVKTYGDLPFIAGSSDSGLALTYEVEDSTVLEVIDGELVIVGAGETEVTAYQRGNQDYLVATPVSFTVTVNRAPLIIDVENVEKVYDGIVFTDVVFSLTGFVYDEGEQDLEGGAVYGGTGYEAVDVGVYTLELEGWTSDNYDIVYEPGSLTISKAVIEGIAFEGDMFQYDGTAKSIFMTGDLPEGSSVVYANNGQIEAGRYIVTAAINGGDNYEDLELSAVLYIVDIGLNSGEFVYDGNPKTLLVTGNIPNDVTVTYSNNTHTNAGVYEVSATLRGGIFEEDIILTATMTIAKASVTGVTFLDGDYVFDGQEKVLEISGVLPDGVTVSYTDNVHTNAGEYQVHATIDGGANYEDMTLDATMTIRQASLEGLLSLDDVSYTYDGNLKRLLITGVIPSGVQVTYENNEQTEVGTYEVVAAVDGGGNYTDTRYMANLTITEGSLVGLVRLDNETYSYDGNIKSLVVLGDFPTGVTVTYENNQQTNVGVYQVTAHIVGGANYEDLNLEATMTIVKGDLNQLVSFEDVSHSFDGTPKAIVLTGILPLESSVTYSNNEHIVPGVYPAVASILGGPNYEDLILEAVLTIEEGESPNINFYSAVFEYDGTEKFLYLTGDLPAGMSVRYVNNGQTEVGNHVVTALIDGGLYYEDRELTANLIITKKALPEVVFENGVFVYDGSPKSIFISTSLPEGVTIQYANNDRVDAGVYRVTATIDGGAYYASGSRSAMLTIEKAEQQLDFGPIPVVDIQTVSSLQLEARSSSGLRVLYDFVPNVPTAAAVVTEDGFVTISHVGEIVVTARQHGNANFKAARPVEQVLRVVNSDVSIHGLWIEGEDYSGSFESASYAMSCSELKAAVKVRVQVAAGATVWPDREFVVQTTKAGIYRQEIKVTSEDGGITKNYVIEIMKPFEFDDIAVQKFKNSLVINNNPKTNGGYELVAFEWFKDGVSVGKEQVYSAGASDLLDGNAVYHAEVTTTAGDVITVCPMTVSVSRNLQIQLYPSPVAAGAMATLNIEGAQSELAGIPIQIYNVQGRLVHRAVLQGGSTAIELPSSLQSGMYMALFELDGTKQTVKFIVE